MCISLISVRPAESVYRPVRPAERMCTGRCDPLRKCVQAGAARRENVYRPVRPAERMCTGRFGPLRECVQAGADRRTVLPYKILVLTSLVKQSFIFIIKQNKDIECLTCAFSRHHVVTFRITELTRN